MRARVIAALETRLAVALKVAETTLETVRARHHGQPMVDEATFPNHAH